MIFTAMIRQILFNSVQLADARLDGITDKGSPYTVGSSGTTTLLLYLDANWTPSFDLGGANFIVTASSGVYEKMPETGGLILGGDSLPYLAIEDTVGNPITSGIAPVYAIPTYASEGSTTLTDYHEYSSFNSVISDKRYAINTPGTSMADGTHVGIYDAGGDTGVSYVKGTLLSTTYFIHLAVPLLQIPPSGTRFVCVLQSEVTNSAPSSDAIDLRQYISSMTWSTSIEKGYDTATIELNESASNLGKYYSTFLNNNIEIIDIYGNICWNGIVTSVYVDGGSGRIDAVGYKHTMDWFRFDKIYAIPEGGWDSGTPGPTSSQVFHDVTLMNPYMRKLYKDNDTPSENANWGTKGNVYDINGNSTGQSWSDAQLTETSYDGLNELDFSEGSFKCSDAIQTIESFGYAYSNESTDPNYIKDGDTVYLQCWSNGFVRVVRVKKDPKLLRPDYIITKKNIKAGNNGIELAGDINDIFTETYVIYNDEDGGQNVSSSTYNTALALKYGLRTKIETSDFGPSLAALISSVARADKSLVVGIGNVSISGNVKGGGGAMLNLPCYMMKAGRIVEFEDNIGHGSLYKNASGTPGIFYIGSTSFNTSSGELTLTPAESLSAVEFFIKRQSRLIN